MFTRPDNYTKSIVHPDSEIRTALQEQEFFWEQFEKTFHVTVDGMVNIYLFNTDEVDVPAGPGGGYSDPATSTIYYRFFPVAQNINGSVGPMGGHELFHLLVGKTWGTGSSRLVAEGGAVWFDGGYSSEVVGNDRKRKSIAQWMQEFAARGELKSPSELAGDVTQIEETVFYPQSGFVIQWIVDRFGLETYTELLKATVETRALESALQEVYGMGMEELNRVASTSGFRSFDEWSNSAFGDGAAQRFYGLVKKSNWGVLVGTLGMPIEDIDTEYRAWVLKLNLREGS